VLDNLPTHKTKVMEEFFERNPKVRFHFTPTYSSWLKQVELWLAIVNAVLFEWREWRACRHRKLECRGAWETSPPTPFGLPNHLSPS